MADSVYRQFFEMSLDMLCLAGTDGYFKKLSPTWSQVLGWTEKELLSRPFVEFVHPDDVQSTIAAASQLGQQEDVVRFTNRYRCKDGSYLWLEWNSKASADGHIYAVARDITKNKHQAQLLEDLQQLAGIGAWEVDLKTMCCLWSNETYRIHEVPVGTPVDVSDGISFYAPEFQPIIQTAVEKAIATGEPWDIEARFFTAKKNELWVRAIGKAHFVKMSVSG